MRILEIIDCRQIFQARDVWSSNSSRRSDYLDSNGVPDNLMDSDIFSLEGGHDNVSLKDAREIDEETSVPLLIVGNKVDKLSVSGKLALQVACAQQVFVVRHCIAIEQIASWNEL